ncbi:MAG: nucleoside-diphosphate sugar epimerase/dehydratase [Opitutales bacterium]
MRNLMLLVCYASLLTVSLYLAYELRFDFQVEKPYQTERLQALFWVVPIEVVMLYVFGQFRGFLTYFRIPDLFRIFGALVCVGIFMVVLWMAMPTRIPPRAVILGNLLFSMVLLTGFRMGMRLYRERFLSGHPSINPEGQRRVAIVGAGDAGAMVAADLMAKRGLGLRPVVFLDDDQTKHGHEIHGVPVAGSPDRLAAVREAYEIQRIIIALPAKAHRRIREVVGMAKALGLETEIVPSMWDLASGRVQASQIRPVELEDLLGRDPVSLDSEQIQEMIQEKVVMVTGAGGSIGSELCRQIANRSPKRLILVDQCEVQMFQIEQEMISLGHGSLVLPIVASVLDHERMEWVLETFKPSILFHAAAHKHVPMMEHQPVEALKNNTLGTYQLAQLASAHQVSRFVLISTDKAINPTSVMGCSKRIAEITLQSIQQGPGNATNFCAVRFGNVLGSSGSVIPTFKRQIAEGGPVTVTHPEVMRYFMTIPEAVGLVLQAASQATGGEIFVLDMGQPMKIVDVARQLIELSGFQPDIDIEIKYVGLRPGEKLFEELQHKGEQFVETAHRRIYRFVAKPASPEQVREQT